LARVARAIGIVSSSVRQMMHDDEPALDSVISGKFAMIDFWANPRPRTAPRRCASCASRVRLPRPPPLARPLARRAPARPHWPRTHGRPRAGSSLDEPCAGLDPVARGAFLQFIQRLGGQRNSPASSSSPITSRRSCHILSRAHVESRACPRRRPQGQLLTARPLGEPLAQKVTLRVWRAWYQLSIHSSSRAVC